MADIESIFLTASPTELTVGGERVSLLQAIVIQSNGDPLQGVAVSFEATDGSLSRTEWVTDGAGRAISTLAAPAESGTVTVTASCGTEEDVATVLTRIQRGDSLVVADPMSEESDFPRVIPADGETASFLTIVVTDSDDHPVSGCVVSFATSLGDLSSEEMETDEEGLAFVQLTSDEPGVARVTVSALTLEAAADVVFITLEGVRLAPELPALPADGESQTTIRIILTDSSGDPIADESVSLSTTLGALSASSVNTDEDGFASVDLTAATAVGSAEITASGDGFSGQVLIPFNPLAVSVSPNPNLLPANGTSTAEVTVRVVDIVGTLVADGSSVTLETNWGEFDGGTTTGGISSIELPTTDGRASATLVAGASAPSGDEFNITATCGPASRSITAWVGTGDSPLSVTVETPENETSVSGAVLALTGAVQVDSGQISDEVTVDAVRVYVDGSLLAEAFELEEDDPDTYPWNESWIAHGVESPSEHEIIVVAEITITDTLTEETRAAAAEAHCSISLDNTPTVDLPRVVQDEIQVEEGGRIGGAVIVEADATPADDDYIDGVEFFAGELSLGVVLANPAEPATETTTFRLDWHTEDADEEGDPIYPGALYDITATAIAGGSSETSGELGVTLDHSPLSAALSVPAQDETATGDFRIVAHALTAKGGSLPEMELVISGEATGTVPLSWEPERDVWVPDNGIEGGHWEIAMDPTRHAGFWSTDLLDENEDPLYPDGEYSIIARAHGYEGTETDSEPILVTVDNSA